MGIALPSCVVAELALTRLWLRLPVLPPAPVAPSVTVHLPRSSACDTSNLTHSMHLYTVPRVLQAQNATCATPANTTPLKTTTTPTFTSSVHQTPWIARQETLTQAISSTLINPSICDHLRTIPTTGMQQLPPLPCVLRKSSTKAAAIDSTSTQAQTELKHAHDDDSARGQQNSYQRRQPVIIPGCRRPQAC